MKKAVSGTTLVDNGENSYVQRLVNNLDKNIDFDMVVVQLSINDAGKNGETGKHGIVLVSAGSGISQTPK